MPENYTIFAYGSLLNKQSLEKTVPEARDIVPAEVDGLKRVFNLPSTYRYDDNLNAPVCVLNAEPAEPDNVMNGICFRMDPISLNSLLQRESGYDFVPIKAHRYRDRSESFQAYYFRAKQTEPYGYLPDSSAQRHYLRLCLTGSAVFGEQFVDDFKRTTSFWGIECERAIADIWDGEY